MGGLKVQFKLMFVSNRFQSALNNMGLPPTTEVEEDGPDKSEAAVEANA